MSDQIKLLITLLIEIFGAILLVHLLTNKNKLSGKISTIYRFQLYVILAVNTLYVIIKYYDLNINFRYNYVNAENDIFGIFLLFLLLHLGYSQLQVNLLQLLFRKIKSVFFDRLLIIIGLLFLVGFGLALIVQDDQLFRIHFNAQIALLFGLVLSDPIISLTLALSSKRNKTSLVQSRFFSQVHFWKFIAFLIFLVILVIGSDPLYILNDFFSVISYPLLISIYLIPAYLLSGHFQKATNRNTNTKWVELSLKYSLTAREREIAELITMGKSNKEIEDTLFISHSTVKNHLSKIYKKFNVNSRLELSTLINHIVS